jgi:C-terminal processing protease CtpA/Prc
MPAALLLALVVAAAAPQPPLSSLDRQRGMVMLRTAKEDIEKHYYDPAFRGLDVAAKFKEAEERIQKATSLNEMYGALTDVLMAFDDSHTRFVPPGRTAMVQYGWRMAAIGDAVHIVWVKPGSDAAAKGLALGDRVVTLNRFEPTRKNLWQIDHLYRVVRPQQLQRLRVRKPDGTERDVDVASRVTSRRSQQLVDVLNDFDELDRSAAHETLTLGGVFVWRMPGFGDSGSVDAAARAARDAKSIVLDLRGNGGGLVSTLDRLVGWFFDRDITVSTEKERSKTTREVARARKDALRAPLFVLVDSESGSAAEVFARVIQIEKRGTVIGDRTAGAVMTSRFYVHSLESEAMTGFGVSVTVADVLMSDGGSLEKVGVTPDELLLPTGADLAAKRDPALARAIALAGGDITPEAAGRLYREPPSKE